MGWRSPEAGLSVRIASVPLLAAGLLLVAGLAACSGEIGACEDNPQCVPLSGGLYQITLTGTATEGSTTLTNSTGATVFVPNP